MIEGAIKSILVGDVAIQAMISGRAYLSPAVQSPVFPFVTYQRVSTTRELAHSGSVRVAEATFQVTAWGSSGLESRTLAAAIVSKFHGYKGTVGADVLLLCRVVNEVDLYDEDAGTYYSAIDISVGYRE